MVCKNHQRLSVVCQCQLLGLKRSSLYYRKKEESPLNKKLIREIDEQYLATPWYGSRQMARYLRRQGYKVGRTRIRRLMLLMGLNAIYRKPNTSRAHPENRIYPYLLRNLEVKHPNQVWCADITYIPMHKGHLYLVAVMDWSTRTVLSWKLSNTMDSCFCAEALEEAIVRFGKPEIFNTDQGSQFTSSLFTDILKEADVKISMDGKGRCLDNVFIERLWRSLKYECVYLTEFENGFDAEQKIGNWINYYNMDRPHSSLNDDKTPMEVYIEKMVA